MADKNTELTVSMTPEMEALLDEAKQLLCDCPEAELLRTLIIMGLRAVKSEQGVRKLPSQTVDTLPRRAVSICH